MAKSELTTEVDDNIRECQNVMNAKFVFKDKKKIPVSDSDKIEFLVPALERMVDLIRYCMSVNEIAEGIKLSQFAKGVATWVCEKSSGMSMRELNDYSIEHKNVSDHKYDLYWEIVLEETPYLFESFMVYMERGRKYTKKFYEPRMYIKSGKPALKTVAIELQNLAGGKYKFLGISMPSRTGKLLADYTPVLTKNGWKNHGDLKVGDYVVGLNGEWTKVTYIHPKNVANKRVWFTDGSHIDCHENHEWLVYDQKLNMHIVIETKYIEQQIKCGDVFELPFVAEVDKTEYNEFTKIEDIEPVSGNCITVDGGIYRVGKELIPTHNSTICIFYLCWRALRNPNSHSAMGGHAGALVKGFYKELLNLMTSPEYTYGEIYGHLHPNRTMIADKSAEDFTINLDEPDRFATLTCRGIDATWTGAIDVSRDGLLYVDDLVRDRQHSLSPTRMEETFQEYLNKMVDRKNDGAQELMVGTLWNVLDPLERLSRQYANNPQYKFLRIPALDENDESNFDYVVNGFSTRYYREMRERLDKAEWQAKFQQNPFVREGLVFENLRYFNGEVINAELKRCFAVCDPAFGGGDSLSMPICYELNNGRRLIVGWIFDRRSIKYTLPKVVNAIAKYGIGVLRIEKTGAGLLLENNIKEEMKRQEVYGCKVESVPAPNRMSKEDKINGYSDYVKENFEFIADSVQKNTETDGNVTVFARDDDYQKALEELGMYTSEGKNPHDDASDSIVQLAIMCDKKRNGAIEVLHLHDMGF